MGWLELAVAFLAFFGTHTLPLRPPVRPWLVARLGAAGFGLAYSALSLLMAAWLFIAAARAPHVPLWSWAPWQNLVPLCVMPVVCLIVASAIGRPNPFSFGGAQNDHFDPPRAGIVRYTRHPLLVALALWAGAHLIPNGDVAHILVFGSFAGFALLGRRLVDRRKKRDMGARWSALREAVAAQPLAPRPLSWPGALVRAGCGVLLYVFLLWIHPWLFGVNPID
ncbi:MAG: NnrU family protein [Roseibium sp.]|nr:NnrU family protein [Roseibium sp.]